MPFLHFETNEFCTDIFFYNFRKDFIKNFMILKVCDVIMKAKPIFIYQKGCLLVLSC